MARARPPVSSPGSCSFGRVIESGCGTGWTNPAGALTLGVVVVGGTIAKGESRRSATIVSQTHAPIPAQKCKFRELEG